jgi:hypothetical protein
MVGSRKDSEKGRAARECSPHHAPSEIEIRASKFLPSGRAGFRSISSWTSTATSPHGARRAHRACRFGGVLGIGRYGQIYERASWSFELLSPMHDNVAGSRGYSSRSCCASLVCRVTTESRVSCWRITSWWSRWRGAWPLPSFREPLNNSLFATPVASITVAFQAVVPWDFLRSQTCRGQGSR